MDQRLDPQPLLPPALQEVAVLWESLRDGCLQCASLSHLPAPTLQHLEEVLQRASACLTADSETLSPDVRKDHAWQLAVLQLLAVAASDVASATNVLYMEVVALCTVLLQCIERMIWLCTQNRTYRQFLLLHTLLARMELLPTATRMVDTAWQDFLVKDRDARSVSRCSIITALASQLWESQLKFVIFMCGLTPDACGELLHSTLACTLQTILDSHLMEHVAFTLLPLAAAEHQVAANAAPATAGAPASEDIMAVITSIRLPLSTAFQALDRAVLFLKHSDGYVSNPCKGLLLEVRQRLLGGPCLQTYVAARVTEALHLLDGSGRAGLPPCWPYLLPEGDGERDGSGRARRLTDADRLSLTWTVCQFTQLLTEEMQLAPPNISVQQAGTASAGNATSRSGQRPPMSKARTFRLALRGLRWATGTGGSHSGARAITAQQQQEVAAAAAASTSAASPVQALPRAFSPLLDNPFFPSERAAVAVIAALENWRGSVQRVERVQARACDALPPITALIHSAVSYSSTVASSNGGFDAMILANDAAVGHSLDTGLASLAYICRLTGLAPFVHQAARAAGVLQACVACVAWLTPERLSRLPRAWGLEGPPTMLRNVGQCSLLGILLSPEQQAAALMVTSRSSFAAATAALNKEPTHPALRGLVRGLHQLLDKLKQQLLEHVEAAAEEGAHQACHGGRTAVFALQQWAVVLGPYVAGIQQAAMRVLGASCVSGQVWWSSAITALCALAGAKRAAEDPAAAAPARAAALRAAASWRALLLRDMRVLDVLACELHTMSRCSSQELALSMIMRVLELAAYALPEEVSQHIAAGRAVGCGRAPPPSAAGRGPMWLAVDGPVRDLLGPTRCNRLPLLACLEGRRGSAAALRAAVEARMIKDLGLPPPCDAQLIETCSYPGCGNGAYTTAAAGAPLSACAKCGCVRYCSRACQAAHWREGHKAECGKGWWAVSGGRICVP